MAPPKKPELGRGCVLAVSPSKQLTVKVRVVPLPEAVTDFISKNVGTIKRLQSEKRSAGDPKSDVEVTNGSLETTQPVLSGDAAGEVREGNLLSLKAFKQELTRIFNEEVKEDRELWANVVDRITAFGPRRVGPNILVDATTVNTCEKL
jgi:ribosome assembly protein 1